MGVIVADCVYIEDSWEAVLVSLLSKAVTSISIYCRLTRVLASTRLNTSSDFTRFVAVVVISSILSCWILPI